MCYFTEFPSPGISKGFRPGCTLFYETIVGTPLKDEKGEMGRDRSGLLGDFSLVNAGSTIGDRTKHGNDNQKSHGPNFECDDYQNSLVCE